jgi:hypothetical protein
VVYASLLAATAASSPARPRCARRSSSNSSIGPVVGIGPPGSRMLRRTAAMSRSCESMVSPPQCVAPLNLLADPVNPNNLRHAAVIARGMRGRVRFRQLEGSC